MIIPMVCFSCGKPIAHLWFTYLELLKKYETDQKNTSSEYSPVYLALRDLKIGRACCRRMFICQHDMYEQVR